MAEIRTANQLEDLRALLTSGGNVSIAVAYVRRSGLNLIRDELKSALSKGETRMLIFLDGRITEPEALQELVELTRDGLKIRHFEFPSSEQAIFHPKLYISESSETTTFLTGSYNLTGAALKRNREHGLRITCKSGEKEGQDALDAFVALWKNKRSTLLTPEVVGRYAATYQRTARVPNDELRADQANWLLKCDIRTYTFDNLVAKTSKTDTWGDRGSDGPKRDTRSSIWDAVKVGDKALFYEFGKGKPAVVGVVQVVEVTCPESEAYKRPVFSIRATDRFDKPVTLDEIRAIRQALGLQRNERISLYDVTEEEWNKIIDLGQPKGIK